MANNRIYLRCKQCGATLFLGKHAMTEYWWNCYPKQGEQPYHLEDKLNEFYEQHYYCAKEKREDSGLDTPFSDDYGWDTNFEIAYEFDDVTKQDYSGEYRKEMRDYMRTRQCRKD